MSPEVIVALVTTIGAIGIAALGVVSQVRKSGGQVEDRITNGMSSVIKEIHADMQLTVMPTLVELRTWKNGYNGTPWADKPSIDAFIERVGGIENAVAAVQREVTVLQAALLTHTEWEEKTKYVELEETLGGLLSRLESEASTREGQP